MPTDHARQAPFPAAATGPYRLLAYGRSAASAGAGRSPGGPAEADRLVSRSSTSEMEPVLVDGPLDHHDQSRHGPEVAAHPQDRRADLLVGERRRASRPGTWA